MNIKAIITVEPDNKLEKIAIEELGERSLELLISREALADVLALKFNTTPEEAKESIDAALEKIKIAADRAKAEHDEIIERRMREEGIGRDEAEMRTGEELSKKFREMADKEQHGIRHDLLN